MSKFHIWVDWQVTTRLNMERLNTGLTAIIGSDVHFEPRDTESDPEEPRNRSLQTTDGIPSAGTKLTPIDIPFTCNPGVTVAYYLHL